eukprot:m.78993 g.78993  ORF g.78993 m.78993 type:complete len:911 (-) comp25169_c0_seq1:353-3085(-)
MNFLLLLNVFVNDLFRNSFRKLGGAIAKRPWVFIVGPVVIAIPLILGFVLSVMTYPPIVKGINEIQYNADQLYTPSSASTFTDRDNVLDVFGRAPQQCLFYFGTDDDEDGRGLLTSARLVAMHDVWYRSSYVPFNYTESEYIEGGTDTPVSVTYQDFCQLGKDGNCLQSSILSFWDYNRTLIASLSDDELNQTIVDKGFQAVEPSGTITLWSDYAVQNDDGAVVATRMRYLSKSNLTAIIATQDDTAIRKHYELTMDKLFNFNKTLETQGDIEVYFWGMAIQNDVNQEGLEFDSGLIPIGFIILVVYATVVLSSNNPVHSHGSLAGMSFLCSGITIGATYGLGCWIGIQYSLVVQVTAFLLVGLGMDDTFVLVAAFNEPDVAALPTKERLAEAMSRAGASITVTTMTDMFAFLIGSITDVPAIQAFCYYSAIGVTINFLFQITMFSAFMSYSSQREKAGRYDCVVCLKASDPDKNMFSDKKYDPEAQPIMTSFMVWYSRHLLTPVGKTVVLIGGAILVILGSVGASRLTVDFDLEWFTPAESELNSLIDFRNEHFGEEDSRATFYTFGVAYHTEDVQVGMNSFTADLDASPHVITGSCVNWWPAFRSFALTQSNVTTSYGVAEADFNTTLRAFFSSPSGSLFSKNMIFAADNVTILGTSIGCIQAAVEGDATLLHIEAMNDVRAMAADRENLGPALAFSPYYIFFEGLNDVQRVILTNVALAIAAVFVVSIIMLGNLTGAVLVLLMLLCIDAEVMGLLYLWGGYLNYVTGINLVLAVGLSVDSCVHICHAFLSADGTGDERAAQALKILGRSVLNGLISTTVIMIPFYVAAKSYVFEAFYQCITGIMLFSAINGLIVLPVLLSLIKPMSYKDCKAKLAVHTDKVNLGDDDDVEVKAVTASPSRLQHITKI